MEAMPEMEKIDFDDFPEYHLPGHESSRADLVLTGSSSMRVGLARVESATDRRVHEHSSICRALLHALSKGVHLAWWILITLTRMTYQD